jgi:hypothetical protein
MTPTKLSGDMDEADSIDTDLDLILNRVMDLAYRQGLEHAALTVEILGDVLPRARLIKNIRSLTRPWREPKQKKRRTR